MYGFFDYLKVVEKFLYNPEKAKSESDYTPEIKENFKIKVKITTESINNKKSTLVKYYNKKKEKNEVTT